MNWNRSVFWASTLLLAWAALLWSNAGGPPPDRSGVTGTTCNTSGCHTGNPVNAAGGSLSIIGLPEDSWTPGVTYPLQVSIARSGQSRFGFQMTAVDSAGAQAGTFIAGADSKVDPPELAGGNLINHIEHSSAKSAGGSATFSFQWTAPAEAGTGAVRFNVAANAANGNFSNTGDFIYATDKVVSPAQASGITSYFPQIADGVFGNVSFRTTIFLANPASSGSVDVTLTFTASTGADFNVAFVDHQGQEVNSGNVVTVTLAAGESRKFVSNGTGATGTGFATITSSGAIEATAMFSQFDAQGTVTAEAAVPASSALTSQSIFVDQSTGFRTAFAYANPSSTAAANITFSIMNTSGITVLEKTAILDPLKQASLFVDELFENNPAIEGHVGTLSITSDPGVAVVALRFFGSVFTSIPPFNSDQLGGSEATSYFPQIADGTFGDVTFRTTIFLANPASAGSVQITLAFTTSTGAPFNVVFVDTQGQAVSSGNAINVTLTPGESRKFVSNGTGATGTGFATISSSGAIEATAMFSQFDAQGTVTAEAAVPASSVLTSQGIFVDQSLGFRTALAYANPSPVTGADITFGLANTAGNIVLEKMATLNPINQAPLFVDELFTNDPLSAGHVGTLRIVSNTGVAVVALRFFGSVFTSVPPFSVAAQTAASSGGGSSNPPNDTSPDDDGGDSGDDPFYSRVPEAQGAPLG